MSEIITGIDSAKIQNLKQIEVSELNSQRHERDRETDIAISGVQKSAIEGSGLNELMTTSQIHKL